MGGGRGASDGNEPGNLSQQAAHVEEVSPLRNQAGDVRCRRIAVCGDDFGMNEAIDGALIELAGAGRLSAVSCMPLAPAFAADAPALARLDVDLGVHVDFTEAFRALLKRRYAGQRIWLRHTAPGLQFGLP
ncbi:ChbG/HpnK family deacetylase, partial [Bordetella pertussis]|uniref:ChbG/HpnK family deacetylase n=1 Tax=Bordetella pertussis TaxID=520 RepID=UPI0013EA346B